MGEPEGSVGEDEVDVEVEVEDSGVVVDDEVEEVEVEEAEGAGELASAVSKGLEMIRRKDEAATRREGKSSSRR